jgi:hypothetical protein
MVHVEPKSPWRQDGKTSSSPWGRGQKTTGSPRRPWTGQVPGTSSPGKLKTAGGAPKTGVRPCARARRRRFARMVHGEPKSASRRKPAIRPGARAGNQQFALAPRPKTTGSPRRPWTGQVPGNSSPNKLKTADFPCAEARNKQFALAPWPKPRGSSAVQVRPGRKQQFAPAPRPETRSSPSRQGLPVDTHRPVTRVRRGHKLHQTMHHTCQARGLHGRLAATVG